MIHPHIQIVDTKHHTFSSPFLRHARLSVFRVGRRVIDGVCVWFVQFIRPTCEKVRCECVGTKLKGVRRKICIIK